MLFSDAVPAVLASLDDLLSSKTGWIADDVSSHDEARLAYSTRDRFHQGQGSPRGCEVTERCYANAMLIIKLKAL